MSQIKSIRSGVGVAECHGSGLHPIINTRIRNVLYALILLACASCAKNDYTEDYRRENFNKNFESFQKLEQMQREDIHFYAIGLDDYDSFEEPIGLKEAIANGYTYKQHNIDLKKPDYDHLQYAFKRNVGLSSKRWDEYKNLLIKANSDLLIYRYNRPDKRQVRFSKYKYNDSGYAYMESPPPKFYKSFKDCQPIMPSQSCFVLLRKNWYLYNERFRLEQD